LSCPRTCIPGDLVVVWGRHRRLSRQALGRSTHHMMTLISWGSLRLTWSLYRDLLHVHPEGGTGVACLRTRLETGILACWSGAVSPTWTARDLRARFFTRLHCSGSTGSCRRGSPSLSFRSRFTTAPPLQTCTRSWSIGRYALTLEAVRVQEAWSGLETQRSQPFRCRT